MDLWWLSNETAGYLHCRVYEVTEPMRQAKLMERSRLGTGRLNELVKMRCKARHLDFVT